MDPCSTSYTFLRNYMPVLVNWCDLNTKTQHCLRTSISQLFPSASVLKRTSTCSLGLGGLVETRVIIKNKLAVSAAVGVEVRVKGKLQLCPDQGLKFNVRGSGLPDNLGTCIL